MSEWFREVLGGLFAIVCAAWVLAHLILIELWGTVAIMERNPYILRAEVVCVALLLILLIERLSKDIRS